TRAGGRFVEQQHDAFAAQQWARLLRIHPPCQLQNLQDFPGIERLDPEQGTACDLCHRMAWEAGRAWPVPNSAQPAAASPSAARPACVPGRMNAASYAPAALPGKGDASSPPRSQRPLRETLT